MVLRRCLEFSTVMANPPRYLTSSLMVATCTLGTLLLLLPMVLGSLGEVLKASLMKRPTSPEQCISILNGALMASSLLEPFLASTAAPLELSLPV